jgi:hypothetical protein
LTRLRRPDGYRSRAPPVGGEAAYAGTENTIKRWRQGNQAEVPCRVEIVFAGFIDDAELVVRVSLLVGKHVVKLSSFEGRRILGIIYAEGKSARPTTGSFHGVASK